MHQGNLSLDPKNLNALPIGGAFNIPPLGVVSSPAPEQVTPRWKLKRKGWLRLLTVDQVVDQMAPLDRMSRVLIALVLLELLAGVMPVTRPEKSSGHQNTPDISKKPLRKRDV